MYCYVTERYRRDVLRSVAAAGVGFAGITAGKTVGAQTDSTVARDRLLVRWPFTSGFEDVVSGADGRAVHGEPTVGTYDGRAAVRFDGDDGLQVGDGSDNPELSIVQRGFGPASFGGWVYFDRDEGGNQRGDSADHHILRNDGEYTLRANPNTGNSDTVELEFGTSGLGGGEGYTTREHTDGEMEVAVGQWHHFFFVLEAGDYLRFYLNGERQFVDDEIDGYSPRVTDYWSDQTIGSWYGTGNPDWYNLLVGKLSDLRVYRGELSDSEIATIYERGGGTVGGPDDGGIDGALTGRMVTPNGDPVQGTVEIYRGDDDELLVETASNTDGWFSLTESELDTVTGAGRLNLLLSGDNWFDGTSVTGSSLAGEDGSDWELNRELLYGPTIAESEARRLGQLSVWRQVGFPDATKQVINVEVTNTNADTGTGQEPSDIIGSAYDLTSGIFTLSFDEATVDVNYGPATDVDFGQEMRVASVDTLSPWRGDIEPVETFHPDETGVPMAGATAIDYAELETTEQEEAINEGAGKIIGTVPVLSDVLTVTDAFEWAVGDPVSESASLGIEEPEDVNPNVRDTAALPWKSDDNVYQETSVVASFPIRLTSEERTKIDVRGEWKFESWLGGFGTGRGYFAEQFEIGPY